MTNLRRARDRLRLIALGIDLPGFVAGWQQTGGRLEEQVASLQDRLTEVQRAVDEHARYVERKLEAQTGLARRTLDDADGHRAQLNALRGTAQYAKDQEEREPLVSIRIASYVRTDELMQVALPSLFAQTYERFEVVIVNDGPNERTRRAIESLRDPRVNYTELPSRERYPEDRRSRWLVAGTAAANAAVAQARGTWVGHLDDDDEYTPDHIEKLLSVAWEAGAELSYGALRQKNIVNGDEQIIWSSPPQISQFNTQGSLFLTSLRFFRYQPMAWVVDEPGDWNLIRRMLDAGVKIAATRDIVGQLNMVPYTHKEV